MPSEGNRICTLVNIEPLNSDVLCQSAEALCKLSLIIYVQSCANFNRLLGYNPLQLHVISIAHHVVLLNFFQFSQLFVFSLEMHHSGNTAAECLR